jgi:hypothetical protein
MKNTDAVTVERLKEIFVYKPESGLLTNRISFNNRIAGRKVGTIGNDGYLRCCVDQITMLVHRVVWAIHEGRWPLSEVDHINGIRSDNRLINLREATRAQNKQNMRKPRKDNTSGFLGVFLSGKSWVSMIEVDGRKVYLGRFSTPEEASRAYLEAKARLHPFQTLVP